jgi:hypothetical protein
MSFFARDEIEYGVFENKSSSGNDHHFQLSLTGARLRQRLTEIEVSNADLPIGCEWQPEYGSWMVEVGSMRCVEIILIQRVLTGRAKESLRKLHLRPPERGKEHAVAEEETSFRALR